ncbi:MAG: cytochrome c oxidase accessory protein CcoG [Proteobacteria bacterium]|nr:cytochrome c oxidase accessory protein CcoG [Cystobacterineae bacterium]MCL2258594.1 cytochrome c oxidase accessory protein CcoG [Cystobacterineae bacterium]MCL2314968.1 cytochrome c oxidase accessory protein CcoG [Pseudomonadota bacterium]
MSEEEKAPAIMSSMRPDGSRVVIRTADVKGRYIVWRRVVFALLIGCYAAGPLIKINGNPAVFLDVAQRRFFLFGNTFNAQDFWIVLLFGLTFIFSILLITAWRGRLWCGWVCPQTVFLEALFRPIERLVDGPRERALKAAQQPWGVGKVLRFILKQFLYLFMAALVAHASVALFVSIPAYIAMIQEGPSVHVVPFAWTVVLTGLFFFNFAWFREQFCVVLCPYGRMQSVLHDQDSVVISYDQKRGEPRGKLAKPKPGEEAPQRGDCVDCKRCIYVCPTAMDIRNGMQMECLACAQCIDACDEVMKKLNKPQGLIRYASQQEFATGKRRFLRPRIFIYAAAILIAFGVLSFSLAKRHSFEVLMIRPSGLAPWVLNDTQIYNQYELHLVNKRPAVATYSIEASFLEGADIIVGLPKVEIEPFSSLRIPIRVSIGRERLKEVLFGGEKEAVLPEVQVRIQNLEMQELEERSARFLFPGKSAL